MLDRIELQKVNLVFWNGKVVLPNSARYQYSVVKRTKVIGLIFGIIFQ